MKIQAKNQGFTIIETLVAITILMVAIAGPLSISSKGLAGAISSRDQMIAAYLAQESIEVIKNVRDNNIDKYPDDPTKWLSNTDISGGFPSCYHNGSGNRCDASVIDSPTIKGGAQTFPLVLSSTGYSHGSSGTVTPFSRYFYLSKPQNEDLQCASTDTECVLTVVVDWQEGSVPYEIKVSTQLINSPR